MSQDESIQKFRELTEKYQLFRSYIDKAESQRSTFRPEVVNKVIEGYEGKCQVILEQLIPLQSDIEARVLTLEGELEHVLASLSSTRAQLEEVELRALIGEITDDAKEEELQALNAAQDKDSLTRDGIEGELKTLKELLKSMEPSKAVEPPPEVEPLKEEPVVEKAVSESPPAALPVEEESLPLVGSGGASAQVKVRIGNQVEEEESALESEADFGGGFDGGFDGDAFGDQSDFGGSFEQGGPDFDPYAQGEDVLGGAEDASSDLGSGFEDLADFGTSLDDRELDNLGSEEGEGGSLIEMAKFLEDLPLGESPKDLPELGNPDGPSGLGDFPELGSEWQNALGDDFGADNMGGGAAAAQLRGYLIRAEGTDHEEYFEVNEDVLTLGRGRDNAIQIKEDTKVSRYHCRLFREGTQFFVEDNNSSNGTLVNGELISKRLLEGGEEVSIGETFFRFTVR